MCNGILGDSGEIHLDNCYCNEDQGGGFTYSDEYGVCTFCKGNFEPGTIICAGPDNILRKCPDEVLN